MTVEKGYREHGRNESQFLIVILYPFFNIYEGGKNNDR